MIRRYIRPNVLGMLVVLFGVAVDQAAEKDFSDIVLGPTTAEIKAAAESGNALAQYKLGAAYGRSHTTNAVFWYRKSARQGNADAQTALARILLESKSDTKEGLKWLRLAANQNHTFAQCLLGNLYNNGKMVKADKVEAYKWYCIARKQHDISGRVNADMLALSMSLDQIHEAEKRADAFIAVPSQAVPPDVRLNGISGSNAKTLAIINGHAFAPGEAAKVKDGDELISVKCLEIQSDAVKVQVDGGSPQILRLGQ